MSVPREFSRTEGISSGTRGILVGMTLIGGGFGEKVSVAGGLIVLHPKSCRRSRPRIIRSCCASVWVPGIRPEESVVCRLSASRSCQGLVPADGRSGRVEGLAGAGGRDVCEWD